MGAILDAALEYAEHGFAVFPVKRSDKSPLTLHGLKDASTDPDTIRMWWKVHPDANVAIATGRASGNTFVIDVDIKPGEGKHGDESLLAWQAQRGDFPNTAVAVTGSGGLHYWFRYKGIEHFRNTVDALPGVDIRGDGAYVVVPPSVYADGSLYRWENNVSVCDDEVADANLSVLGLLAQNRKEERTEQAPRNSVKDVQKGSRNSTIYKYACAQRGQDVPYEVALEAARMLNSGWSEPLPDAELVKTVTSAFKYEPNERTIYTPPSAPIEDDDELEAPTVDEFEEEEVEWIIPGYLPRGQISILCGNGGTGKTSLWVSLAASLSAGRPTLFDGSNPYAVGQEPMKIMFFSGEDTVENVIKKKLHNAGANMKNIRTVSLSSKNFDKIQFGSKYLEGLFRKYKPDLCVFDPIQSFVDRRIKMSDRNAIRQNMRTLIEWGSLYGTASLVVMHTNKLSNVWGRQRMADSADLWDIARCVWMVGDVDDKQKYLSHEKSNYGKTGQTMLFQNSGGLPRFSGWSDKKDRDYVIEASKKRNSSDRGKTLNDVCNAILSELAEHPEGVPAKDMDELMLAMGHKAYLIKDAKKELKDAKKIKYSKHEMNGNWWVKKA